MSKFSTLDTSGEEIAFVYDNVYFRQTLSSGLRLTIGPADSHVDILLALAASWANQQYYILYVLLVAQSDVEPGRYESPVISSLEELRAFFSSYQRFFEEDGRHHIWIASASDEGLLIYDQHNVIFAYGELSSYESVLRARGLAERDFWFPSPHCHSYPSSHVVAEEAVLAHFPWYFSPLQEGDRYE